MTKYLMSLLYVLELFQARGSQTCAGHTGDRDGVQVCEVLIPSVSGMDRQGLDWSGLLGAGHLWLLSSPSAFLHCAVWLGTLSWALGFSGHRAGKAPL